MVAIFGNSGHAHEVAFLLDKCSMPVIKADCFVVEVATSNTSLLPTLSEEEFTQVLSRNTVTCNAYIAIGSSKIREKIVEKFKRYAIKFENLVVKNSTVYSGRVEIGVGNIVFPNVFMTTGITIGSQNHFNLGVSISHDCVIGNYNTFSPGVRIAGTVHIGNNNFFGLNSCVIDGVSIAHDAVIGAGAVVTADITEPGTYVGVPARKIK